MEGYINKCKLDADKFDNWVKNRDIREFNNTLLEEIKDIKELDKIYNKIMED